MHKGTHNDGMLVVISGQLNGYASKRLGSKFSSTVISHAVDSCGFFCNYCFACFYEEQHLGAQFASVFALSNPNRPHKAVVWAARTPESGGSGQKTTYGSLGLGVWVIKVQLSVYSCTIAYDD
jgi:hypothetical protein